MRACLGRRLCDAGLRHLHVGRCVSYRGVWHRGYVHETRERSCSDSGYCSLLELQPGRCRRERVTRVDGKGETASTKPRDLCRFRRGCGDTSGRFRRETLTASKARAGRTGSGVVCRPGILRKFECRLGGRKVAHLCPRTSSHQAAERAVHKPPCPLLKGVLYSRKGSAWVRAQINNRLISLQNGTLPHVLTSASHRRRQFRHWSRATGGTE